MDLVLSPVNMWKCIANFNNGQRWSEFKTVEKKSDWRLPPFTVPAYIVMKYPQVIDKFIKTELIQFNKSPICVEYAAGTSFKIQWINYYKPGIPRSPGAPGGPGCPVSPCKSINN